MPPGKGMMTPGTLRIPDAAAHRLLQGLATETEEQQADSRPAIGGLVRAKKALDPRLRIAADDGRRVSRRHLPRRSRPLRRRRRDDEPRCRHAESLGES